MICVIFANTIAFSANLDNVDSLKDKLTTAKGKEKSLILYELSEFYQNTNSDEALKYAEECLEFSKKIRYNEGTAKALKSFGVIYHFKGDFVKSLGFLLEAKEIFEDFDNYKELTNISIDIGNSYFQQRQYDNAFEYYLNAKVLSEEINDEKIYAKVLNSIGHIYKIRNEFSKAIRNNEEALKIWEKFNDIDGIIYCTVNNGIISHSMGKNQEALSYYYKALDLKRQTNADESELYYFYNNIAIIYSIIGELEESNIYFYKALKLVKQLNKSFYISTILINLARNYLELNNYPYAIAYSDSAFFIAKDIKSQSVSSECYKIYSSIYRKMGNFKEALKYKELHYTLKDSIFTEQSRKRIEELEIIYDTEKKEKKIAIQNLVIKKKENQNLFLYIIGSLIFIIALIAIFLFRIKIKRNTKLKETNKKLIESKKNLQQISEAKDKLFSVIVHDLKNPFGTLISVTDFLEESYHEIDEEHKIQTVKTIKNSALRTYQLLENLLSQASPYKFTSSKSKNNG